MKINKWHLLGVALLVTVTIHAQGVLDNAGNIVSNLYHGGAVVAFYGQKMTDAKTHVAGGLYSYNMTQQTNGANAYAAMGYDHLWSSRAGAASANYTLSGGFNVDSKEYYPSQWLGVTNSWLNKVAVKGISSLLVGTPTQGSSSLMNVERIGGMIAIHDWTAGNFVIEPDIALVYGNRSGVNPTYDGNWWNIAFAFSIHGKKP